MMFYKRFIVIIFLVLTLLPLSLNADLPLLKIQSNIDNAEVYSNEKIIGKCEKGKLEVNISPGRYEIILKAVNFSETPLLYSEYINAKMNKIITIDAILTTKQAEENDYENISNIADMRRFLETFPDSKYAKEVSYQIIDKENQFSDDIGTFKEEIREKLKPMLIFVDALDENIEVTTHVQDIYGYNNYEKTIKVKSIYSDYKGITELEPFYLGKYEVTESFYDLVMLIDRSLSDFSKLLDNLDKIKFELSGNVFNGRPKNRITWFEAVEFCNALSRIHNLTPVYYKKETIQYRGYSYSLGAEYPYKDDFIMNRKGNYADLYSYNRDANGYRLPSLDEWVFASRGGNKSRFYTYSGGPDILGLAIYKNNSNGQLAFVGSKRPNELGIYDMSGNVWEWCWDGYKDSNYHDLRRINRGGDYRNEEDMCRINNYLPSNRRRDHNPPSHRSMGVGFRIAKNK